MYRQVLIDPEQTNLQKIVWRKNPQAAARYYTLNTLTYGTKPAAFLATRCLKQITLENVENYPHECEVINKDMYMDDVLTGAENVHALMKVRENLSNLLAQYKFEIRKFQSNDTNLLKDISQSSNSEYIITNDSSTKTLGVIWIPSKDVFQYNGQKFWTKENEVTKRTILSFVAKVSDPLGLLGPILIRFKFLTQVLWQLKISWDDPVPDEIFNQWIDFQEQLSKVNLIQIQRHVLCKNPVHIEIHVFSDASEKAYASAVYLRSTDRDGNIECPLLCAKSRVAPIKAITLPRLELCGALLSARLLCKCLSTLDIDFDNIYLWTDSTIVLSWIAGQPRMWKTFISNRVAEIQKLSNVNDWNYISTSNNPSDIISRGAALADLIRSELWWHGPKFLRQSSAMWPKVANIINFSRNLDKTPEFKTIPVASFKITIPIEILDLFERFSDYNKLIRVTAYCLRFINNLKSARKHLDKFLTPLEINDSTELLCRLIQRAHHLSNHIENIEKHQSVSRYSPLKSLSPFLDEKGLLRVGGRLQHSDLPHNHKHPIILPSKHPFLKLLILNEHKRALHAGSQTTLAHIRQNFWIINGKRTVKSIIRNCVKCFRVKPSFITNKMGQLPNPRVTPSLPFISSAVDFAGPFDLKDGKVRNRTIIKGYILLFICLKSKAVHLELISDLTSEGFLSMLKRFVSRRGLCEDLFSDNATNFVGANNQLKAIGTFVENEQFRAYLSSCQINWHFIPARSPHFGGLWEAAVKSCKHHLKRTLNQTPLTYEEFYSLLTQVEAVLNSRPITPLSTDPHDLEALTPGHFMIGRPLSAIPQRNSTDAPVNYVRRYRLTEQRFQHFWSRWVKEYLHQLQQRTKWQFDKAPELQLGSMVILKEDNVPPLCWPLGRIDALHPGTDGVLRVVSVKTRNGVVERCVNKLSLLPIE